MWPRPARAPPARGPAGWGVGTRRPMPPPQGPVTQAGGSPRRWACFAGPGAVTRGPWDGSRCGNTAAPSVSGVEMELLLDSSWQCGAGLPGPGASLRLALCSGTLAGWPVRKAAQVRAPEKAAGPGQGGGGATSPLGEGGAQGSRLKEWPLLGSPWGPCPISFGGQEAGGRGQVGRGSVGRYRNPRGSWGGQELDRARARATERRGQP